MIFTDFYEIIENACKADYAFLRNICGILCSVEKILFQTCAFVNKDRCTWGSKCIRNTFSTIWTSIFFIRYHGSSSTIKCHVYHVDWVAVNRSNFSGLKDRGRTFWSNCTDRKECGRIMIEAFGSKTFFVCLKSIDYINVGHMLCMPARPHRRKDQVPLRSLRDLRSP